MTISNFIVVATRTPDAVPDYPMIQVKPKDGDAYVVNAGLTTHYNPRTGDLVDTESETAKQQSEMIRVKNPIKSTQDCMGVKCPSCSALLALPKSIASRTSEMHCVVCGTHLEYESQSSAEAPTQVDDKDSAEVSKISHKRQAHDQKVVDEKVVDDKAVQESSISDLKAIQKLSKKVGKKGKAKISLSVLKAALESKTLAARRLLTPFKSGEYALIYEGSAISAEDLMKLDVSEDAKVIVKAAKDSSDIIDLDATSTTDEGVEEKAEVEEKAMEDMDEDEGEDEDEDEGESMEDKNEDEGDKGEDEDEMETSTTSPANDAIYIIDMIPEAATLSFKAIGDTQYGAFVGDILVASMDDTSPSNVHILTPNFAEGFKQVCAEQGSVAKALKSAGFKMLKVHSTDAVQRQIAEAKAEVSGNVQSLFDKKMDRIKRCMDIAASGGIVGMFRKDGMNALSAGLVKELESQGFDNAEAIVSSVLPGVQSTYSENLLATAMRLAEDTDASLDTLSKQIQDMEPDNVYRMDARLTTGGHKVSPALRQTATASTEPSKIVAQDGKTVLSVGGLFRGISG